MTHKGTVTLETERLLLRRFKRKDLEQIYYNCWGEKEVWGWTNYAPMNCIAEVLINANMFTDNWMNAYERENRYSWAIQLKERGEVIGRYFGMHPDDELREVELACEIGSKWWNRGLVYAWHASGNPASGRMQEKAGLKYEGTLRAPGKCNNGIFDKVVYAILAEDYGK